MPLVALYRISDMTLHSNSISDLAWRKKKDLSHGATAQGQPIIDFGVNLAEIYLEGGGVYPAEISLEWSDTPRTCI